MARFNGPRRKTHRILQIIGEGINVRRGAPPRYISVLSLIHGFSLTAFSGVRYEHTRYHGIKFYYYQAHYVGRYSRDYDTARQVVILKCV